MFKKISIFFLGIMLFGFGFLDSSQAQVENIEIGVDGLACPFCAFGLEKKLKKIKGVGEVKIYVDKGLAVLGHKKEQSIIIDELAAAVKDAGFTPGAIKATVVGKVTQSDGTLVFSAAGSDIMFMINENDELQKLRSELQEPEKKFRITGRLVHENPKGHHAHPYTLSIEKFEVL